MNTAHLGRSALISLLSIVLFLNSTCTGPDTEEEKRDRLVPPHAPPASKRPVPSQEDDTARKPTQDSVKKPVRMMNYKSFRKSYTIHKRGFVVGLFSKLYKA